MTAAVESERAELVQVRQPLAARRVWQPAELRDALNLLLGKFDRAALAEGAGAAREAELVAGAGLAEASLLAAAALCAGACCHGRAITLHGPWAASRLLAGIEFQALPFWEEGNAADGENDEFLRWLEGPEVEVPTLLMTGEPSSGFMETVRQTLVELLVGWSVNATQHQAGTWVLAADLPAQLELQAPRNVSQFPALEEPRFPAAISVLVSRLWQATALAQSTETDILGWCPAVPVVDAGAAALLASPWRASLPEVGRGLALPTNWDGTLSGLARGWAETVGAVEGSTAASALRSHARLLWTLAAIAARCPVAGYRGLLLSGVVPATDMVLHGASPGDVFADALDQASGEEWALMEGADGWRIRPLLDSTSANAVVDSPGREVPADTGGIMSTFDSHAAGAVGSARVCEDQRAVLLEGRRLTLATGGQTAGLKTVVLSGGADEGGQAGTAEERISASAISDVVTVLAGDWQVVVNRRLLGNLPSHVVEVQVALQGDRAIDLATISAVQAVLDRYPGSIKAQLLLTHASFRRLIERGPAKGVTFSAEMQADVVHLLGTETVCCRLDVHRS